jgi:hypothetical protein
LFIVNKIYSENKQNYKLDEIISEVSHEDKRYIFVKDLPKKIIDQPIQDTELPWGNNPNFISAWKKIRHNRGENLKPNNWAVLDNYLDEFLPLGGRPTKNYASQSFIYFNGILNQIVLKIYLF